jgi:hypothetical protein
MTTKKSVYWMQLDTYGGLCSRVSQNRGLGDGGKKPVSLFRLANGQLNGIERGNGIPGRLSAMHAMRFE